jgi:inositol-phosphate phosphatase/L-galactose 1-phosphate phosphatase/histidinol-phosphatase
MLSSSTTTAHSATSSLPGPASANLKPRSRLLRLRAASPVASAALSVRGRPPRCTVRATFAAGAGGWGAAAVGELATERLVEVAQRAADAAEEVLWKY